MSTFALDGLTDDILFEAERKFLHKIVLEVVKCAKQSGFLQRLIDFHQILADNTFPTSNMLHFKALTLMAANFYSFTNYFVHNNVYTH